MSTRAVTPRGTVVGGGSRSPVRAGTPRATTPSVAASAYRGPAPTGPLLKGSLVDVSRRLNGLNSRHASPATSRRDASPRSNTPVAVVRSVTSRKATVPRNRSPAPSVRSSSSASLRPAAMDVGSPRRGSLQAEVAGRRASLQGGDAAIAAAAFGGRRPSLQLDGSVSPPPAAEEEEVVSSSIYNGRKRMSVIKISRAAPGISRTASSVGGASSLASTAASRPNIQRAGSSSSLFAANSGPKTSRSSATIPSQTVVRVRTTTPRGNSPAAKKSAPRSTSAGRWRRDAEDNEVQATIDKHTRTIDVVTERARDPEDGNEYVYTTTTTTTEAMMPTPTTAATMHSNPSRPLHACRPPSLTALTHHQANPATRALPSRSVNVSPLRSLTPRTSTMNNPRGGARPQTPKGTISNPAAPSALSRGSPNRTRAAMSTSPARHVVIPSNTTASGRAKSPVIQQVSPTRLAAGHRAAPVSNKVVRSVSNNSQHQSPPSTAATTASAVRATSPVLTKGITSARAERWVTEFEELLRTEHLPYAKWRELDIRGKQQLLDRWRVPEMKRRVILEL